MGYLVRPWVPGLARHRLRKFSTRPNPTFWIKVRPAASPPSGSGARFGINKAARARFICGNCDLMSDIGQSMTDESAILSQIALLGSQWPHNIHCNLPCHNRRSISAQSRGFECVPCPPYPRCPTASPARSRQRHQSSSGEVGSLDR